MRNIFTLALIASAIRLATPLLLAALGGLFSERAGIINIALEGLMLAGAFTAATVTHFMGVWLAPAIKNAQDAQQNWKLWLLTLIVPLVGLLAAMVAGLIVAALHAVACIRYKADQVVTGTAINILFLGIPALLSGALFESTGATPSVPVYNQLPTIPIVIAFALVPLTWYVLNRTPFGLRLRAVGENPEAADTSGVSVARVRYTGVLISGALAAIGGAYLSIGQSSLFTRDMTSGRGFIALAALIFGKWKPVQTMLACLFFGFAQAVAIQMQGVVKIPVQFIDMIPYVLTVIVLAGFIGLSRAPRALGIPYQKEK
ncbi:MAG TPA: ABC transporter permease [Pyrinomonadaceae bacterium]